MALVHPSIADKFTYLEEDVFSTSLIAVRLIADGSKKEPLGCIRVRIKDVNKEAVKNLSGYYIFNIVPGEYYVEVESDLYDPMGRNVNTSTLDPKNPVVEFILKSKSPK